MRYIKKAQQTSYEDKFNFTQEENTRFARANLTKLVYTAAHCEDIQTTLTQTQTIMDGISVGGAAVTDIITIVNEQYEQAFLQKVLADSTKTTTDKALTMLYHNMRQQIFADGNKRTALLIANQLMIAGGAGLINVPLDKWDQWQQLIVDYYQTNDILKVKQWTYDHGIQGVAVRRVH